MSHPNSPISLRQPCTLHRRPSKPQRRPSGQSSTTSTLQRRPSGQSSTASTPRRRLSAWPSAIPTVTPSTSVHPKEYLTALADLLSDASAQMAQIDLPGLIWAFNRADARNDRIAMRQLGGSMLATLENVQDAYREFCDTRGTFEEEDIWKMVMGLGDEGSDFWDVAEELGDLIEIMEGEETEGFWRSLEDVLTGA